MVEIKKGSHTIYKKVPDDWKPENESVEVRGDLTTGTRKTMGFTDIPQERWDAIFGKNKKGA